MLDGGEYLQRYFHTSVPCRSRSRTDCEEMEIHCDVDIRKVLARFSTSFAFRAKYGKSDSEHFCEISAGSFVCDVTTGCHEVSHTAHCLFKQIVSSVVCCWKENEKFRRNFVWRDRRDAHDFRSFLLARESWNVQILNLLRYFSEKANEKIHKANFRNRSSLIKRNLNVWLRFACLSSLWTRVD